MARTTPGLRRALLYNFLKKRATRLFIIPLLLLIVLINGGFMYFGQYLNTQANTEVQALDLRNGYSYEEAMGFFELIGEEGRRNYFMVELLLDTVYPLIYSLFFCLLLIALLRARAIRFEGQLYIFCFLPFLIALVDYIENTAILFSLASYPDSSASLLFLASLATQIKWLLLTLVLAALLVGIFAYFFLPAPTNSSSASSK